MVCSAGLLLNGCSNAIGDVIIELNDPDITDDQRVSVNGPRPHLGCHPRLSLPHQVLQVGEEFVDVTCRQIDISPNAPAWKIYANLPTLLNDWGTATCWKSGTPLVPAAPNDA